jgi:leader peptidase (prepilin peptidase)/N-methyltransferase
VRTSLDLLHPLRSICLVCGAPIPWYDNLPIVSYLVLRGRCRRCGAPIGRRTLVLEAATPLIGLAIYAGWGWSAWTAAAWLAASWSAVALALRAERRAAPRGFRLAGVAIAAAAAWAAWLRWGTGA